MVNFLRRFISVVSYLLVLALAIPSYAQVKDGPQVSIAEGPKLLPVDEAYKNPDFKKFRDSLQIAIREKDLQFLIDHLDEGIQYSFGPEPLSVQGFLQFWELDVNPKGSGFWLEIDAVLRSGGTVGGNNYFTAPYLYSCWPDTIDSFNHAAVIEPNVSLHSKPEIGSPVIAKLDYNIVEIIYDEHYHSWNPNRSWNLVKVNPTVQGYVEIRYVGHPNGMRAAFENKDEKWKMTYFIGGD